MDSAVAHDALSPCAAGFRGEARALSEAIRFARPEVAEICVLVCSHGRSASVRYPDGDWLELDVDSTDFAQQ